MTMMCIHLNFDYKKATQALNYLARKAGGQINYMKAVKHIFFADKFHTRKYGRPITKDEYRAIKYGPIPVGTLDIAKENSDFLADEILVYSKNYINKSGFNIISQNAVDEDVFSETDLEALEFSFEKFKDKDEFELADYTHEYPEWSMHKYKVETSGSVWMDVEDFLIDPPKGVEKCFELSEEWREMMRSVLRDQAIVDQVLE